MTEPKSLGLTPKDLGLEGNTVIHDSDPLASDKGETGLKPHKGSIKNWFKYETDKGLGYLIRGKFVDHPEFAGMPNGNTSYVVAHDEATGEIETRNSRYTLIGPACR